MSNHLSPAQTLPIDVLRSIFKWVVHEWTSPLHVSYPQKYSLKELRTVCSTWRQMHLEFQWKQLNMTINFSTNKVDIMRPGWIKQDTWPHNIENLAKDIELSVHMPIIVLGVARNHLFDYIKHISCFPNAKKLTLKILDFHNQHHVAKDIAITNALEFAKLLRSMVPAALMVNIVCDGGSWSGSLSSNSNIVELEDEIFETLADVLYDATKRAHISLINVNIINLKTMNSLPPLSRIKMDYDRLTDINMSLVHKSADTLQYLSVGRSVANMIICDSNGDDVVYSRLEHLQLSGCIRDNSSLKRVSTKVILFPLLRSLIILTPYPFVDDVLFRGNSASLEYLELFLDATTIGVLNQFRVFEDKDKVLRHVFVQENPYNRDLSLIPDGDMNNFLKGLVSSAERLAVGSDSILKIPMLATQSDHGFQHVKVFGHHSVSVSFFYVLSLLKALPTLVELRCGISGWGAELENIAAEELPDHVASTYCVAETSLQMWTIAFISKRYIPEPIHCVLLLALMCPKLWRIRFMSGNYKDAQAKIVDALNSPPYNIYAPQLNRLLDIIRN